MTDFEIFSKAMEVIGKRWREDQSKEQERIFFLVQDALTFISQTGQWYPFLDFMEGHLPRVLPESRAQGAVALNERMSRTERYFESLLDDPDAAGERASIHTLLSGLRFIHSTGQVGPFEEYLARLESNAPPLVLAAFETRAQAEAWLKNHPNPPHSGEVLVGNNYHSVVYDRASNHRSVPSNNHFKHYLGELEREDLPVAQVSFDSLEQAEAWLRAQAHPALRTWVRIGGEFYLAVYHPNVQHRALYPLSMAIRPPDEDAEDGE